MYVYMHSYMKVIHLKLCLVFQIVEFEVENMIIIFVFATRQILHR